MSKLPTRQGSERVFKRRVASVLSASGIVSAVVLTEALSWLPASELLDYNARDVMRPIRELAPEGWSFFTKSPRGDLEIPYRRVLNDWQVASRGPNDQLRYWFGWNRESRLTDFDLEPIRDLIPRNEWIPCSRTQTDAECLGEARVRRVASTATQQRLCGFVGIVARPPVPWVFRHQVDRMPGAAVSLDVRCEG
jgi:antimicrobial peptide system SdpA family protein